MRAALLSAASDWLPLTSGGVSDVASLDAAGTLLAAGIRDSKEATRRAYLRCTAMVRTLSSHAWGDTQCTYAHTARMHALTNMCMHADTYGHTYAPHSLCASERARAVTQISMGMLPLSLIDTWAHRHTHTHAQIKP